MKALPSLRKPTVSPQIQINLKQRFEVDLSDYEQLSMINRGACGIIYKVREKRSSKYFAAKIVNCYDDEEECERVISREVEIMNYLHHKTIVEYFGYSRYDFSKMKNVTIIMEYADNGSLRNLLDQIEHSKSPKNYDNTNRQIILVGVARGMKYLHDRSIIHRDLKPENVLICEGFRPRITDFGLSKFFEFGQSQNQSQSQGTPLYMAPEVQKGEPYGRKSDVYSFGLLMFEVVTDSRPFKGINLNGLSKVVYEKVRPQFKCYVKDKIRELIERCWDDDPNERPTFKEIFEKLSNFENDDYLLDDVDVNELKIYLEDIKNRGDPVENLLKEIDNNQSNEEELVKLREEINRLKIQNEIYDKEIKKLNEDVKLIRNETEGYQKELEQLIVSFNSLSLSKQKEISDILSKEKSSPKKEFFIKISKLISYLQNLKDIETKKCIEISIDHKFINKQYDDEFNIIRIQMLSEATEIAYKNKLFKSQSFQKLIKSFGIFSIQIKYPSDEFESIYDIVVKLKNDNIIQRISILINEISDTDLEFNGDQNIDIVKLDSSLTPIQSINKDYEGSFEGCVNLSEIMIPSSVTEIGGHAFSRCSSLTQITIPSSVTKIGENAFSECSSLMQITIPSSVTEIGSYAFSKCSSLKQITIPSSLTGIRKFAFFECSSLTQITIPSSTIEIEENAFSGCSSLIQAIITSSVTKIGESAFSECSSLVQMIIPSSVTEIGSYAFYKCSSLTKIAIPSSITEIKKCSFSECLSLTQVTIPSSVNEIGEYAFSKCSSLIQVTIPSSLIGSYSFSGCSSLTKIVILSSVTEIGGSAFSGCSSLTQIVIPSSITEIRNFVFSECSSLTQVTIPSSITKIGSYAFSKCSSLTQITIPSSVTKIGNRAFSECSSLIQITIPSSVVEIGKCIFSGCKKLDQIDVSHCDKTLLKFYENRLLVYKSTIKIDIFDVLLWAKPSTKINIPQFIEIIDDYAFSECSSLTQITIPPSVTKIGNFAFSGCSSLTKVTISSCANIGEKIFSECPSLVEVIIPSKSNCFVFPQKFKVTRI